MTTAFGHSRKDSKRRVNRVFHVVYYHSFFIYNENLKRPTPNIGIVIFLLSIFAKMGVTILLSGRARDGRGPLAERSSRAVNDKKMTDRRVRPRGLNDWQYTQIRLGGTNKQQRFGRPDNSSKSQKKRFSLLLAVPYSENRRVSTQKEWPKGVVINYALYSFCTCAEIKHWFLEPCAQPPAAAAIQLPALFR